jgi:deoxyribodipyrimidine photo-lyase
LTTGILWFRQDLRLADNPALSAALAQCARIVPVYIHAPEESGDWAPGAASRWWLHHSLDALDASLRARGARLQLLRGESLASLRAIARETGATHCFWNRLYEPAHIARDTGIKRALREDGLTVESHDAALLFEPWAIAKGDGGPYKVFTPYWRACLHKGLPSAVQAAPESLPTAPDVAGTCGLDALELLPDIPWDAGLAQSWTPGEDGAQQRLEAFVDDAVDGYDGQRDLPAVAGTSRLSPHLHFGEIGPRQVVLAVEGLLAGRRDADLRGHAEAYLREIGWREFAHHLLYHFPHTAQQPLDTRFEAFAWAEPGSAAHHAWQRGQTGIPIVDAGMRELWHTGWMHNRVRMIVASFLTKNLLTHWLEGARWFWDTLVDADLASNTMGWQWTAGSGADAAPYFRVFNPVLQGEKFDPEGAYTRRWVPELTGLPDKYLHKPWQAPRTVMDQVGIELGRSYPRPIVDLKESRARALERFARIKAA